MTAMKKCGRCGTEKFLEKFSKHKKCKDGYQGTCLDCTAEITSNWYKVNKARKAETNMQYELRNPQRKALSRRRRIEIEPARVSAEECEANLRKRYGITIEEYAHMFNSQDGRCKTCKHLHSEFARGLVVDHSHVTGKVRGLLCDPCNRSIGYLKENIETLRAMIEYLNQNTLK